MVFGWDLEINSEICANRHIFWVYSKSQTPKNMKNSKKLIIVAIIGLFMTSCASSFYNRSSSKGGMVESGGAQSFNPLQGLVSLDVRVFPPQGGGYCPPGYGQQRRPYPQPCPPGYSGYGQPRRPMYPPGYSGGGSSGYNNRPPRGAVIMPEVSPYIPGNGSGAVGFRFN